MHRFWMEPAQAGAEEIELTGPEHAHLSKVLRLQPGDEVELLDGAGIWKARIDRVQAGHTTLILVEALPDREAGVRVWLYIGMNKGDKMDLIVQKASELGAEAVVPVLMRRSVRQEAAAGKVERWRRIAREASKQCGRARALRVEEPKDFPQAKQDSLARSLCLMPYEKGGAPLGECLDGQKNMALWIGPEGGFDPAEAEALLQGGAKAATLGPRILRAETAAIAALSAVMALSGEWGNG